MVLLSLENPHTSCADVYPVNFSDNLGDLEFKSQKSFGNGKEVTDLAIEKVGELMEVNAIPKIPNFLASN